MQSAKIEQDYLGVRHEVERFKEDVATLKAQLAELGAREAAFLPFCFRS
jgi:hypothetical protein